METLDPQAVNLAKAIRQTESGGNFQAKGKSGEYGAYQFTQPTWDAYSKKHGVNVSLDKATPEQQNEVAYKQIKEWKDSGLNVGQIASMWNSGKPDAYKDTSYKGTNKMGVTFDVPAYAKSVATAYQSIKNGGNVQVDRSNPSSVVTPQFPLTSQKDVQTTDTPNPELQAGGLGSGENKGVLDRPLALEQGLGYALSNLTGTQDKVIEAQNQGNDIETSLLKRIKEKKARGEDTSRLQNALTQLTGDLQKSGNSVGDVGTGGITNNQVMASGGLHALAATIPYASGAINGGGLLNTARGLSSGELGSVAPKAMSALTNSTIQPVIENMLGKGETLSNLSRGDLINGLGNYLKEMPASEVGGSTEQAILRALKALNPTPAEQSLLSKGLSFASKYALTKALGDSIGGILHNLVSK